jgi:hypothetical protein
VLYFRQFLFMLKEVCAMAVRNHLLVHNSGKQMWQILVGNIYAIGRASNWTGVCMTLVIQWLLEIHFDNGQMPDALARYLLHGNFGRYGYSTVFQQQNQYYQTDPQYVQHLSGGVLACGHLSVANSANAHWLFLRQRIFGINPAAAGFRLDLNPQPYSGLIGIYMRNKFTGWRTAHAIGVHCNGVSTYIFDPNYGVFVFRADQWGPISQFFQDLWGDYGAIEGDLADIA